MYTELRRYIKFLLEEKTKKDVEILAEPDLSSEDEREKDSSEQSVVSSIAGVTTPLGTGPTYPINRKRSPEKNKKRSPAEVNGAAFAGAKPVKNT